MDNFHINCFQASVIRSNGGAMRANLFLFYLLTLIQATRGLRMSLILTGSSCSLGRLIPHSCPQYLID